MYLNRLHIDFIFILIFSIFYRNYDKCGNTHILKFFYIKIVKSQINVKDK